MPYWDVAPVLIGVNVIVAALSPRLAWTIAYLVATLVFGWLVVYLNRRAVRGYFVPLRDEIERILREES